MAYVRLNTFASDKTVAEMDNRWEVLTSPENLYCDGEISQAEARVRYTAYQRDYAARSKELNLA